MKPTAEELHLLHYTEAFREFDLPHKNSQQLASIQSRSAGAIILIPYIWEHPQTVTIISESNQSANITIQGTLHDDTFFSRIIACPNSKEITVTDTSDNKVFFKSVSAVTDDSSEIGIGVDEVLLQINLKKYNNMKILPHSDVVIDLLFDVAERTYPFLLQIHNEPTRYSFTWPPGYWAYGWLPWLRGLCHITGYVDGLTSETFFFNSSERMQYVN